MPIGTDGQKAVPLAFYGRKGFGKSTGAHNNFGCVVKPRTRGQFMYIANGPVLHTRRVKKACQRYRRHAWVADASRLSRNYVHTVPKKNVDRFALASQWGFLCQGLAVTIPAHLSPFFTRCYSSVTVPILYKWARSWQRKYRIVKKNQNFRVWVI